MLRPLIDELVDIQRGMSKAAQATQSDPSRRAELVDMRRRFANHISVISEAIDRDPQMQDDLALRQEFRHRFSDMRSKIAIHQAKWPAVLLDRVNPEFNASASALVTTNRAFAAWAQSVLRA